MSPRIIRTKTLGDLKRMYGRPVPGYGFHQGRLTDENTVDLYVVPLSSPASAPLEIPEGGRLIGIVKYESRAAALEDRS